MTGLVLALLLAAVDPDAAVVSPWAIPVGGDDTGVFLGAQVFTGIDATVTATAPGAVVPAFRLDRLELGGGGRWQRRLGGLVRLEAIRSAAPQSAFGIDGNSLLPRLKLAYGNASTGFAVGDVAVDVELRAGLVPEVWLETLERRLGARGLLPLPSERAGLLSASDLGATLAVAIADGLFDVRVAIGNGEGRTELERNASKNLTAVAAVVPIVLDVFGAPLAIGGQLGGRYGTLGIADVADHRLAVALFASHPRLRIGCEAAAGQGLQQRSEQRPLVVGGFVDALVVPAWLGLAVRGDTSSVDVGVPRSFVHRGLIAAFSDLGTDAATSSNGRARLFGGIEGIFTDDDAGPIAGIPAAGNALRVFVQLEMTGLTDVVSPTARIAPSPGD